MKKRYFWVTLDRHYWFLRSKSKLKKLTSHLLFFVPFIHNSWMSVTVIKYFSKKLKPYKAITSIMLQSMLRKKSKTMFWTLIKFYLAFVARNRNSFWSNNRYKATVNMLEPVLNGFGLSTCYWIQRIDHQCNVIQEVDSEI